MPCDKTYGVDLFSSTDSEAAPCMTWLDKQEPCSVVLASYGTVANLNKEQLDELGNGLCDSGKPFVWVLRSNEAEKLSRQLGGRCKERGLIVPFCPQLEVLAHKATGTHEMYSTTMRNLFLEEKSLKTFLRKCYIGCFLTHCGWNSTIESIASGVPMVAMPQWADQPTTAKYVESAWGIGVRMRKGSLVRKEVERCIREVMGGERKHVYGRNAARWMHKAKEAMQEGGSSDKNIAEFAAKYLPK